MDTTEATTQPDTFNPNRDGQPLGGGDAEPTDCKGTAFGKTVWYDLAPQVDGRPGSAATGGVHAVVAVYEWNRDGLDDHAARSDCSTTVAATDCWSTSSGKKNYTIQVGGVGGAGGPVTLQTTPSRDDDGDGVLRPARQVPDRARASSASAAARRS